MNENLKTIFPRMLLAANDIDALLVLEKELHDILASLPQEELEEALQFVTKQYLEMTAVASAVTDTKPLTPAESLSQEQQDYLKMAEKFVGLIVNANYMDTPASLLLMRKMEQIRESFNPNDCFDLYRHLDIAYKPLHDHIRATMTKMVTPPSNTIN
jgi:hypothetical protein